MSARPSSLPSHSELPKSDVWDLTPLFSDADHWERDFARIHDVLRIALARQGSLAQSAATLAQAFAERDQLERLLENLHVYAHLKADERVSDSTAQTRLERITAKFAEVQGEMAWFEPEILDMPDDRFEQFVSSAELSFYQRTLNELRRSKKHTLSQAEERILAMSSDVISSPGKIFAVLNDADLRFPSVEDASGDHSELTHGNYLKFLKSSDRNLRRSAFIGMHETYGKLRNTFAATLNAAVKGHVLNAKTRRHPSALAAALHPDNVPIDVYDRLVATARAGLEPLRDYFATRRDALDLEFLDMWDIHNPLVPSCDRSVAWDEAKTWVSEALAPLGDDYSALIDKAYADRWIDHRECRGKRSGAYSSGSYDSPPYVLMNYNGTLQDVFTLAHELGHSMHSHLSNQALDFHYAGYRLFVAEVASITNELLLHAHLVKNADEPMRIHLLNHLLDEIRGTFYRQTMFAEFEKFIHEQVENGHPLTADHLCETYFKLNADYHGDAVHPNRLIEMEWARIPHFHYDFYVYKYATGLAAAAHLSKGILSGDSERLADYLNFLSSGDTKDVLDLLRDAGVDLESPHPARAVVDLFRATAEEIRSVLL